MQRLETSCITIRRFHCSQYSILVVVSIIVCMSSDGDPDDKISVAWTKERCPVLFEGKYGSPQFKMTGPCPEVSTSILYYAGSKLCK